MTDKNHQDMHETLQRLGHQDQLAVNARDTANAAEPPVMQNMASALAGNFGKIELLRRAERQITDWHTLRAAGMYDVRPSLVTREQRDEAKRANFREAYTTMTSTHTFVELEVSQRTHDEVKGLLEEAGYDHAFMPGGIIDMHGLGLIVPAPQPKTCAGNCGDCASKQT